MGSFGKFLMGCTVAGLTAAGVLYVLDKSAKQSSETPSENDFSDAVDRTYATIKSGAESAYTTVKEKVGPKGEEVFNVVGEAAGRVKDVLTDSAAKMKEVFSETAEKAADEAAALA